MSNKSNRKNARSLADIKINDSSMEPFIDEDENQKQFDKYNEEKDFVELQEDYQKYLDTFEDEAQREAYEKHLSDEYADRRNIQVPLEKGSLSDTCEINYQGVLENFLGKTKKFRWKTNSGEIKKNSFLSTKASRWTIKIRTTFENESGIPISYIVSRTLIEDYEHHLKYNNVLEPSFIWHEKKYIFSFWVIYNCDKRELKNVAGKFEWKLFRSRVYGTRSYFSYKLLQKNVRNLETTVQTYNVKYFVEKFELDVWLRPTPLKHYRDPVATLSRDMMPSELTDYVVARSKKLQCSCDYFAVGTMSMLGSIIGHKLQVKSSYEDSYLISANFYSLMVGYSGSMKSAAMKAAYESLINLEATESKRFQDEVKNNKSREHTIKGFNAYAKKESVKHTKRLLEISDRKEFEYELENISSDLEDKLIHCEIKTQKIYSTSQVTLPALVKLLSENPNGFVILTDEINGLLEKTTKKDGQEYRSFLLEAYDGNKPFNKDTLTKGRVTIEKPIISIIGTIQPQVLEPYIAVLKRENTAGDGWYNRFLLTAYPDSSVFHFEGDIEANPKNVNYFNDLVCKIDELEQLNSNIKPFDSFIVPAKLAQSSLDKWSEQLALKIHDKGTSSLMVGVYAKSHEMTLKVALVFEVIDSFSSKEKNFNLSEVSDKNIKRAIKFVGYLHSHLSKVFDDKQSNYYNDARAIWEHIVNDKPNRYKDGFTARDVKQNIGKGLYRQNERVEIGLDVLAKHGYLKKSVRSEKDISKIGRKTYDWRINPYVF
jgi:hypothetical protein